jgi:glutamate synthase (NADPH/NADH) small chain
MSEFNVPVSEEEFNLNFAQIKPLMTPNQAHFESARCLFCYDAPCVTACPTGIDIPLFIKQIHSGNVQGAAKTIYESNYFGHACGKVCPTEVLCEGSCVYHHQGVPAIEIGRLQSFATRKAMDSELQIASPAPSSGKKAAVIGAGPAGIACACELRQAGVEVEVFEAKSLGSGLTVYGVAPYKITNEEAIAETEYLQQQFGFTIHYNKPIHSAEDIALLEERFDLIFIGVGLGNTSSLSIEGEHLPGVEGAVEFVEKLRMEKADVRVPSNVIVLGAGNTAMDAASESARMGASEVSLVYRRSRQSMGAYPFEYELAKSVGVKGVFNAAPLRIFGKERAEGVEFICTKEENGRLENIAGSEFIIPAELVLKATGQSRQHEFLQAISGLELDKKGNIVTKPETFCTTNSRYYAAGDAVSGGQEVVNAVANGKKAAKAMASAMGIKLKA